MSDENNPSLYGNLEGINGGLRESMDRSLVGWENSPFAWIRQQPSRRVGAVGEAFVSQLLNSRGFNIQKPNNTDHDMLASGVRLEVKFSTLWEKGKYKFQQIRNQDYDGAIFLGISPSIAHMWYIPKPVLMSAWADGHLVGQHGGSDAKETAWIEIDPLNPPSWMDPYGPEESKALAVLSASIPRAPGFSF